MKKKRTSADVIKADLLEWWATVEAHLDEVWSRLSDDDGIYANVFADDERREMAHALARAGDEMANGRPQMRSAAKPLTLPPVSYGKAALRAV